MPCAAGLDLLVMVFVPEATPTPILEVATFPEVGISFASRGDSLQPQAIAAGCKPQLW